MVHQALQGFRHGIVFYVELRGKEKYPYGWIYPWRKIPR